MAMLTVRNLPDEVHRALRIRAAMHGHSTEAEVRSILEQAVNPESRVKLGSLLAAIGSELNGQELVLVRDNSPAKPLEFE